MSPLNTFFSRLMWLSRVLLVCPSVTCLSILMSHDQQRFEVMDQDLGYRCSIADPPLNDVLNYKLIGEAFGDNFVLCQVLEESGNLKDVLKACFHYPSSSGGWEELEIKIDAKVEKEMNGYSVFDVESVPMSTDRFFVAFFANNSKPNTRHIFTPTFHSHDQILEVNVHARRFATAEEEKHVLVKDVGPNCLFIQSNLRPTNTIHVHYTVKAGKAPKYRELHNSGYLHTHEQLVNNILAFEFAHGRRLLIEWKDEILHHKIVWGYDAKLSVKDTKELLHEQTPMPLQSNVIRMDANQLGNFVTANGYDYFQVLKEDESEKFSWERRPFALMYGGEARAAKFMKGFNGQFFNCVDNHTLTSSTRSTTSTETTSTCATGGEMDVKCSFGLSCLFINVLSFYRLV